MKAVYLLMSALAGTATGIQAAGSELSTLIEYTIAHNYNIRNAEFELQSSSWVRKTSMSAFFPSIEAGLNTRWNEKEVKARIGESTDDNYNSHGYSVSVKQTILNFGEIHAYNISDTDYRIEELRHHKVVNDTIVDVVENYFSFLKFHAQKKATQAELTSSQVRLKQIKRNNELGNLPKTDVYEAQSQQESNARQLASIQRNINIGLIKLRSISQSSVLPAYDLDLTNQFSDINESEKADLQARLLDSNYDIVIAKNNFERSKDSLRQSRSNFYPTLSASANYEFTDSNVIGGSDTDEMIYSLNLSIPITNGGANYFSYQKSKNELAQLSTRYEQSINDSQLSFEELVFEINNNVESLRLLTSVVKANYSVYKGMQSAYKIGSKTLTDLLSSESDLFDSIRDYYTNQYDYVINITKLNALFGPLNLEHLALVSDNMVPLQRKFDIGVLDKLTCEEYGL